MRVLSVAVSLVVILGLAIKSASAQDFTFDRQRPFAVADRDVSVREITFAGPTGEATEATLVAPAASGRHPAVLFVHWYGPEHTTSNRTQYVPDALALARHGIVSLLVDTPWSEPSWFRTRQPDNDVTFSSMQVKRIQRAVDVLASLNRVATLNDLDSSATTSARCTAPSSQDSTGASRRLPLSQARQSLRTGFC